MTRLDVAPAAVLTVPRPPSPVASRGVVEPRPEGRITVSAPASSSRLGVVIAVVGGGLFVTGLGDALARTGHEAPALPMFFVGLLAIFVPCAWRLTSGPAARRERLVVSVVLGVGLLASYYMRSPLIFDWFDELIHGATINNLLDNRTLLVHNSILPVSPYYPGLELVTVAVKWLTGLPLVLAELVVVVAARVLLVLGVFLVVERVCGSARAGGIGVLVYAANPSFYTFASWDYGPLALSLAVATVYFLLSALDHRTARLAASPDGWWPLAEAPRRRLLGARRDFCLALAAMAAMVVTHHLTAWLTAGLLVLWAVGLHVDGRRDEARVIGVAAATNVVLVAGWSAFVGSHLVSYLGPLLSDASTGFGSLLGRLHGNRQLFHTAASQGGASSWEIVVMLGAAASLCLLLCPSVLAGVRRRTLGGGVLRFLPVVVAAGYPFAMVASLSSGSSEVGERTTTFIFFGMAIVVGAWLAARLAVRRGPLERVATVLVATLCFLGGMIYGSGPDVTYVPGPYLVGANQRSVSAPSLAVAEWASTHLPAGSNVAADRQNGALLADVAHVNMVISIGGFANASPLFFNTHFGLNDVRLIRQDDISYVVIDRRLASSLPLFGSYLEPGEATPGTRLTLAELSKFDDVAGVTRVYDNGPIQVYDVSALLGPAAAARATGGNVGDAADATNAVVLPAALATGALLLFVRLRRRRRRVARATETSALRTIVALLVVAYVLCAALIGTGLSSTEVGLLGLLACVVVVLLWWPLMHKPWRRGPSASRPPARRRAPVSGDRDVVRWAVAAGIVLGVVGLLLATIPATGEWRPPDHLAISSGPAGQTIVTAQLAAPTTDARVEVVGPHDVVVWRRLQATTAPQSMVVPASVGRGPVKALLQAPGSSLAVWS